MSSFLFVFCRVLRDHIRKLSKVVTPEHPKLGIPPEFLLEAPWFFCQQQILQISAYKTAQEKVGCVVRCIKSIMKLLSMSSGSTPSADDLTPVLIFVLIKVGGYFKQQLSGINNNDWGFCFRPIPHIYCPPFNT